MENRARNEVEYSGYAKALRRRDGTERPLQRRHFCIELVEHGFLPTVLTQLGHSHPLVPQYSYIWLPLGLGEPGPQFSVGTQLSVPGEAS